MVSGAPGRLLVALFAIWIQGTPVEQDLSARSGQGTSVAGEPWASVEMRGRDARLTGEAPTAERRQMALDAVNRVWGVRQVADESTVLPTISPYAWSAERAGARVVLGGHAPSSEARAAILAAARRALPGIEVVDQMRLASGAPAEAAFDAAIGAGVAQLARMSEGRASLSDLALTVEGRATTAATFAEIGQALRTLPQGVSLAREAVRPPLARPFAWTATREATRVVLTGVVPSETARAEIVARARASNPGLEVVDQTTLADGAEAGFPALAGFGVDQLGRFTTGRAAISDLALTVEGTARDPDAYAAALAAVRTPPGGGTLAGATIGLPTVSPYVWGAERSASGVTLTGFVPSEQARAGVLATVARVLPGVAVVDNMRLAAGASPTFAAIVDWSVTQLARLRTGRAALQDAALTLSVRP